MTTPNTEPQYEPRSSIGSIRFRWRPLHSLLFVLQSLTGIIIIIWFELAWETGDSAVATFRAIHLGITIVCGSAIGITAVISEGLDLVLGTRDAINEWLKKRRDEAKAEGIELGHAVGVEEGIKMGHAEGHAAGVAEGIAETLAWIKRRDEARENDEPFDEPPPGSE